MKSLMVVVMGLLAAPVWGFGLGSAVVQAVRTPAGQASSQAEMQVWTRVSNETNLKRKSQAAEDYLKQYPEGGFAPWAHEIIAVNAHQNSDMDRFFEHAEKAVAGLPNEVSLMSSLSAAYAEKQQPDPAIRHGEAALAILPTMERPEEYLPETWPQRRDQFMADAHYGTGTAYLFKAFQEGGSSPLMAKATEHLQKAAELMPRDERIRFRLGFAWDLQGNLENAVVEYARSVALEGVNSLVARQYLEQAYQKLHGNRKDLDKLVAEQKKYLKAFQEGGR